MPSTGDWFVAQHVRAGSGTVGLVFLGDYFLTTTDPANIKVLLATEFSNFEKGEVGPHPIGSSLIASLFQVPFFAKQRRLCLEKASLMLMVSRVFLCLLLRSLKPL